MEVLPRNACTTWHTTTRAPPRMEQPTGWPPPDWPPPQRPLGAGPTLAPPTGTWMTAAMRLLLAPICESWSSSGNCPSCHELLKCEVHVLFLSACLFVCMASQESRKCHLDCSTQPIYVLCLFSIASIIWHIGAKLLVSCLASGNLLRWSIMAESCVTNPFSSDLVTAAFA